MRDPGRLSPRPFEIERLRPDDTPEYMTPAWLGCIHWALGTPEIVTQFREDTGLRWTPGRNALDKLIDQATGAEQEFLAAFVQWVNVNVWGHVGEQDQP